MLGIVKLHISRYILKHYWLPSNHNIFILVLIKRVHVRHLIELSLKKVYKNAKQDPIDAAHCETANQSHVIPNDISDADHLDLWEDSFVEGLLTLARCVERHKYHWIDDR